MKNGRKPRYTKELVSIILDALREGDTNDAAMTKAGISKQTFYRWLNEKSDFRDEVKRAKEDFNKTIVSKMEASLWKVALGYETEETQTEYTNGADGNPIISKQITKTKHFQPNVTALIFGLSNRDPENWKNRQWQEITGKDGKDLKPIDISLSNVSDDLLGQVIDQIKGK